jgi:hypothetical protein
MMKTIIPCILLWILSLQASAQRASSGTRTITNRLVINEYATLTANAFAGQDSIGVADVNLNANNRFDGPLKPGNLLLIIQMQGATLQSGNGIEWGSVLDYQGAGNYEWAEVREVYANGIIRLTCGLRFNYTVSGHTQVLRVPRFETIRILNGASVTAAPWDGTIGGIIAIECADSLIIETGGSIDANGTGFRGGRAANGSPEWAVSEFVSALSSKGAEKGESIAGFADDYLMFGGQYCKGAPANGGGGGNAHNCGGGGGSNGGLLSDWSGLGNPDTSTNSWKQAWELENVGFADHKSSGGGKGGYSFSGVNKNALITPPGDPSWDGDWRRNNGGLGGRPLDDQAYRLFAGGGGGAGDANDNSGGSGGRGGGIIAIRSYGTIAARGTVMANGSAGGNAGGGSVNGKDAAGGGGGGGSILLELAEPLLSGTLQARGGNGGNQDVLPFIYEGEGPGGGGGGGRVLMPNASVIPDMAGGRNGNTDSWGFTEFPPNGATSGGFGSLRNIPLLTGIKAKGDTLCTPGIATLVALPAEGQDFYWTNKPGGLQVSNADTLRFYAEKDTLVFLASCFPVESIPVKVVFTTAPLADAGGDTAVCPGSEIQLSGIGNGKHSWAGPGIVNTDDSSPKVYIEEASEYIFTVTSKFGCNSSDTLQIEIEEIDLPEPEYEQETNFRLRFFLEEDQGGTYTWLIEDSVYTGSEVFHEFPFDGIYQARLLVSHACGEDTVFVDVQVVKIASIHDPLMNVVQVFPNPSDQIVYFKKPDQVLGFYKYSLFDASGRVIHVGQSVMQDINAVQTKDLPDGIYLLQVQTDKYIYRARFIHCTLN